MGTIPLPLDPPSPRPCTAVGPAPASAEVNPTATRPVVQGVERLASGHLRILELALEGWNKAQIARELGLSAQGVGLAMRSALFQDELARRRLTREKLADESYSTGLARTREVLEQGSTRAAERLTEIVESEDETEARLAAQSVLGFTLPSASATAPAVISITAENLQLLTVALAESEGKPGSATRIPTVETRAA